MTLQPGNTLGNYQIVEKIGRAGELAEELVELEQGNAEIPGARLCT